MSEHEDRAFFEHMATCRDAYRRLGDCIAETFFPATWGVPDTSLCALDLGAGLGYVVGRMREQGWKVEASDLHAPEDLREPGVFWCQRIDLSKEWGGVNLYPVVICTETAEHIPELHADAVVRNVACRATRYIVWSAAQPGQGWPGHVNLQPPAYWLERFARHGWAPDEAKTALLRRLMLERHAQHEYCASNFFVLSRG